MQDETKRMAGMVQHLLTLARMDSGALEIYRESFDLVPVLCATVRKGKNIAINKGIVIHTEIPVSSQLIYADKERITQLLHILLDNAVKYTPNGGEVSVGMSVIHHKGKKLLEIIVKDTGIGIPEKELPYIFERFYRVDKARSREAGGTGLGLSIARWIVEAHRGTIQVQSQPGQGSRFIVHLPIDTAR
jgi:signal transduction histidine kinase